MENAQAMETEGSQETAGTTMDKTKEKRLNEKRRNKGIAGQYPWARQRNGERAYMTVWKQPQFAAQT